MGSRVEPEDRGGFEDQARMIADSLSVAFTDLLTSLGGDPNKPQQCSRAFGLNTKLAWQISKVVQARDSGTALAQMPGQSGIGIFLKKMESAGAGKKLLDAARAAVDGYYELLDTHAGDRASLDMLSGEISVAGRQQQDEHYRKQWFQSASYIWGAQAKTILKVGIAGPSESVDCYDYAALNSVIDFRCLRGDVTWPLALRGLVIGGSAASNVTRETIDPRFDAPDQPPFMPDFCSDPLPEMEKVEEGNGYVFQLAQGQVGNLGLRTCTFGTILRGVYLRFQDEAVVAGSFTTNCDTPVETLIADIFIHKRFDFAIPPRPVMTSRMSVLLQHKLNSLPLNEPLQNLGLDPLAVTSPEVPKYRQMVRAMFERCGWNPEEFVGFRLRIAYPPCPTMLRLQYEFPKKSSQRRG